MNSTFSHRSIIDCFNSSHAEHFNSIMESPYLQRKSANLDILDIILDIFPENHTECSFLRYQCDDIEKIELTFPGGYRLESIISGGWLLAPIEKNAHCYWIPQAATLRSLDQHQRILKEQKQQPSAIQLTPDNASIEFTNPNHFDVLDLVIWKIPTTNTSILNTLTKPQALEKQAYYLWSSHTNYQQLADAFNYLIHGQLYENTTVWPHYWKICSELDAHALYVILRGLELATNSEIYTLIKYQILFSIIARQSEDGGWYHGEWTDLMESHYRLHCGGMHLLMDALSENADPLIEKSLRHAAAYIAAQHDKTDIGVWFRHDSLENSLESLNQAPFTLLKTTTFGKSPSNMLVLNTHLDTTVALERYRRLTQDEQYTPLVKSARAATQKVLSHQPADWLYKPLFWAVDLTFLPENKAQNLPVWTRALKRITWKYLIPKIYKLKAIYPRFVMPNGYIDRDLGLKNLTDPYLSVNLWDLLRHEHYFAEDHYQSIIDKSLAYTHQCGLLDKWAEMTGKQHSLVFWAEALYQRCLVNTDSQYRDWLAETVLLLEDRKLGLAPSSLGGYGETVPAVAQKPCHTAPTAQVRIINLCNDNKIEFLFINTAKEAVTLNIDTHYMSQLTQGKINDTLLENINKEIIIPGKSWFIGYQTHA